MTDDRPVVRPLVLTAIATLVALRSLELLVPHSRFPALAAAVGGIASLAAGVPCFRRRAKRLGRQRLVDASCASAAVATASLFPEWVDAELRTSGGIAIAGLADHGVPALVVVLLTGYVATVLVVADAFFNFHRLDR